MPMNIRYWDDRAFELSRKHGLDAIRKVAAEMVALGDVEYVLREFRKGPDERFGGILRAACSYLLGLGKIE